MAQAQFDPQASSRGLATGMATPNKNSGLNDTINMITKRLETAKAERYTKEQDAIKNKQLSTNKHIDMATTMLKEGYRPSSMQGIADAYEGKGFDGWRKEKSDTERAIEFASGGGGGQQYAPQQGAPQYQGGQQYAPPQMQMPTEQEINEQAAELGMAPQEVGEMIKFAMEGGFGGAPQMLQQPPVQGAPQQGYPPQQQGGGQQLLGGRPQQTSSATPGAPRWSQIKAGPLTMKNPEYVTWEAEEKGRIQGNKELTVRRQKALDDQSKNYRNAVNALEFGLKEFYKSTEAFGGGGRIRGLGARVLGALGKNPNYRAFKSYVAADAAVKLAKIAAPSSRVGGQLALLFEKTMPDIYSTDAESLNQIVISMKGAFSTYSNELWTASPEAYMEMFPEGVDFDVFERLLRETLTRSAMKFREDEAYNNPITQEDIDSYYQYMPGGFGATKKVLENQLLIELSGGGGQY